MSNHLHFLAPKKVNPDYPLFVFLPGTDGTGQLLQVQTESLERCFDVRSLALPQSDRWSDWDALSRQTIDLIEAELANRERPVYLCGESFGGCLALKVALRSPELVDRLILVNPASSLSQRPYLYWGASLTRCVPEPFYRTCALVLLPFLSSISRIAVEDRRALLAAMRSVPPKTVRWRVSLLNSFEVSQEQLRRLKMPVLLLAGGADRLLPSVTEARRLASYLNDARVVLLPDSGHTCLLERDTKLYDILHEQGFLGREAKLVD